MGQVSTSALLEAVIRLNPRTLGLCLGSSCRFSAPSRVERRSKRHADNLPGVSALTPTKDVFGHTTGDADVDLADFSFFQVCFSGPNRPASFGCAKADFDSDADVDLADFAVFQACFNGPNRPPA